MRKSSFLQKRGKMVIAILFLLMTFIPQTTLASAVSEVVTPDNPSFSYTAGPFALANVSGTVGDIQCGTATPCDDHSFSVNTPAGYDTDHNLKVTIHWSNSLADFDLYVLNAQGQVISSSASSSDPEAVILPPTSGTYTIRVVPYAPLNETFTGTVSLVNKPTNPTPADVVAPGFDNYAAPDALTNAHNAGEPSIGVNWKTGSVMYQSYTSTYQVKFDDSATPATVSWADKSAAPPKCTGVDSLDPILFTDPHTGRTFESQLLANPVVNSLTCFSDDDGDTWQISEGGGVGSGVDHQTLGGGPFAPVGLGPTTSYPNAIYYCSQDIAAALCSTSHDGGVTFTPAVPVYTLTDCSGIHGHVKVSPQGTVYLPNGSCNGNQAIAVSEDNGTQWTVRRIPASTPAIGSDPSVDIGANGTVYFGYQNSDGHARVAVSHDHGVTWVNDQDLGSQLSIQNIVFPAVIAGDDDRAAVAFLGTTTGGNYQATDFSGVWHLYVSFTYDGGSHWKTIDATPNDPVQRGPVCTGGTSCSGSRNLLDFIGATVDQQGRVLVGYADGCTGTCVQGGANTGDALATIARQTDGMRLFSQYDPQSDLTVGSTTVSGTNKQTTLNTTVTNQGKARANQVVVRFFNGTEPISDSVPVTLKPGESQRVQSTWNHAPLKSASITAIVDPDQVVAESNETNNKSQSTVSLK